MHIHISIHRNIYISIHISIHIHVGRGPHPPDHERQVHRGAKYDSNSNDDNHTNNNIK